MIHHFNFIAKLSQIYERIQELFRNKVKKDTMLQEAVLIFLDYETTLAYNKAPLSDSVYKAENKRLTEEWEEIKRRYEILYLEDTRIKYVTKLVMRFLMLI